MNISKKFIAPMVMAIALAVTACSGPSTPAEYGKEVAVQTMQAMNLTMKALMCGDAAQAQKLQEQAKECQTTANELQSEFDKKYSDDVQAQEEFLDAFAANFRQQ